MVRALPNFWDGYDTRVCPWKRHGVYWNNKPHTAQDQQAAVRIQAFLRGAFVRRELALVDDAALDGDAAVDDDDLVTAFEDSDLEEEVSHAYSVYMLLGTSTVFHAFALSGYSISMSAQHVVVCSVFFLPRHVKSAVSLRARSTHSMATGSDCAGGEFRWRRACGGLQAS